MANVIPGHDHTVWLVKNGRRWQCSLSCGWKPASLCESKSSSGTPLNKACSVARGTYAASRFAFGWKFIY